MHAAAMAADPGIIYWNPATLAAMDGVRRLRAGGTPVFFTIDAGPHVKALCAAADADAVAARAGRAPRRAAHPDRRARARARGSSRGQGRPAFPNGRQRRASCSSSASTACSSGGTAVVAAVDRRVAGRFVAGATPASPLVAEAVRLARAHLDAAWGCRCPSARRWIDSAALGDGQRQAGARLQRRRRRGRRRAPPSRRRAPTSRATAARCSCWPSAPTGRRKGARSGADVAAAVFGGVIAYGRTEEAAPKSSPLTAGPSRCSSSPPGRRARPPTPSGRSKRWLRATRPRHAARMNEVRQRRRRLPARLAGRRRGRRGRRGPGRGRRARGAGARRRHRHLDRAGPRGRGAGRGAAAGPPSRRAREAATSAWRF